MLHPRPYLSHRQLVLIETSDKAYADVYYGGKELRPNKSMILGKEIADALENDEDTGDVMTDLVITKLPKFERMDKAIEDEKGVEVEYKRGKETKKVRVPTIIQGKIKIPLLCLPDTSKEDYSGLKEFKTGTIAWNQKLVDNNDQITFYVVGSYITTGKVPNDLELCYAPTEYTNQGELVFTGEVIRYKTKRTIKDILMMQARMVKAWERIGKISEQELL